MIPRVTARADRRRPVFVKPVVARPGRVRPARSGCALLVLRHDWVEVTASSRSSITGSSLFVSLMRLPRVFSTTGSNVAQARECLRL